MTGFDVDIACAVIFAVCIFYTTIVSTQLYKSKIQWPKNCTAFKSDLNLKSRIATKVGNYGVMSSGQMLLDLLVRSVRWT